MVLHEAGDWTEELRCFATMLDGRSLAVDVLAPATVIRGIADRLGAEELQATFRGTQVRLKDCVRFASSSPDRLVFRATYVPAGDVRG